MRFILILGLLLLHLGPLQTWAQPIQAPGGPCQIELPTGWKREEDVFSYPKLHLKILFDAFAIEGLSADQKAKSKVNTVNASTSRNTSSVAPTAWPP